MKKYFRKFNDNIKLTESQKSDARIKVKGVCEKLHAYFYSSTYNGTSKLLIGSYGKKTYIRPARDVDVLFKIPEEYFEQYDICQSNGQSNLLQKIRALLMEKYPKTNIKAFEKVVVVEFADANHNIELLPAFELEDKQFKIPNSKDNGSWEVWNPRAEIKSIFDLSKKTDGKSQELIRMLKKWAENCSVSYSSYHLECYVRDFFDGEDYTYENMSFLFRDFFSFLSNIVNNEDSTHVETALKRVEKAIDFFAENKIDDAVSEYKKIFGMDFPSQDSIEKAEYDSEYHSEYHSSNEEHIEDYYPIRFNDYYTVKVDCLVTQDGFRPAFLKSIPFLHKKKKLKFSIGACNVPEPYQVFWKVKNYGNEASRANDLRGEITVDAGNKTKNENTKYMGVHNATCYIIKNNVCVAFEKVHVPIKAGAENE